jgi:26S proteasome regulatory subunit N2
MAEAGALSALLEEEDDGLKAKAVEGLFELVDTQWAEVAQHLPTIEALAEDGEFSQCKLASLLASKVLYHLGELPDALHQALNANELFDLGSTDSFATALLSHALDLYSSSRSASQPVSSQLEATVDRLFSRCFSDNLLRQAVGLALESSRLDQLERAVSLSSDPNSLLHFALSTAQRSVRSRHFRIQVLQTLVSLHQQHLNQSNSDADYLSICQCHHLLQQPTAVAQLLEHLVSSSHEAFLRALQIAFELYEAQDTNFTSSVHSAISSRLRECGTEDVASRRDKLLVVLSGDVPVKLHLDFMFTYSQADLLVIRSVKSQIESRNSVLHGATVLANAIMYAGTTVDIFLRENLEWLAKASNWAKFSATAGLGVIHKGQIEQGKTLMEPYLPSQPGQQTSSPYSEGGALYALGIIYANHGHHIRDFINRSLQGAQTEAIQHGACLGLGLSSLGEQNESAIEDLKNIMYADTAIAGEAAGIALGMLLAGTVSDKSEEMLAYAHETSHEKIVRGISLGLAITCLGREDEADTLIEQMVGGSNPLLRHGGAQALSMAYCGTASNAAMRKLLHLAVTDVSDDVRRASVVSLGFVLCSNPEQCPRVVALLAESYNPHVRYGAAMAVGIACAGTSGTEALSLLEPLTNDSIDFVRQGSLIAQALVLMHSAPSRADPFRKHLDKLLSDKHEETLCKMGAAMAVGILDAGGRNATVQLRSRTGQLRQTAVVGMLCFTQFWFWYPLAYTLSLALEPAALICLNSDLNMPQYSVVSNAKPSRFAYPEHLTVEKGKEQTSLKRAVLSTSKHEAKKQKQKEAERAEQSGDQGGAQLSANGNVEAMETDQHSSNPGDATSQKATSNGDMNRAEGSEGKKEDEEEPSSEIKHNPMRVVPQQQQYIAFPSDSRYVPLKRTGAGITMLQDTRPGEPEDHVKTSTKPLANTINIQQVAESGRQQGQEQQRGNEDDEAQPPAPFEYSPDLSATAPSSG